MRLILVLFVLLLVALGGIYFSMQSTLDQVFAGLFEDRAFGTDERDILADSEVRQPESAAGSDAPGDGEAGDAETAEGGEADAGRDDVTAEADANPEKNEEVAMPAPFFGDIGENEWQSECLGEGDAAKCIIYAKIVAPLKATPSQLPRAEPPVECAAANATAGDVPASEGTEATAAPEACAPDAQTADASEAGAADTAEAETLAPGGDGLARPRQIVFDEIDAATLIDQGEEVPGSVEILFEGAKPDLKLTVSSEYGNLRRMNFVVDQGVSLLTARDCARTSCTSNNRDGVLRLADTMAKGGSMQVIMLFEDVQLPTVADFTTTGFDTHHEKALAGYERETGATGSGTQANQWVQPVAQDGLEGQ